MTTSFLSFNDRNPDQTSQTKIYQRLNYDDHRLMIETLTKQAKQKYIND